MVWFDEKSLGWRSGQAIGAVLQGQTLRHRSNGDNSQSCQKPLKNRQAGAK
jgi:hypothetical protein